MDIPDGGYSLNSVFMDFAADQDVTAAAGANYATFNNLFNLAITYHEKFTPAPGNTFDPGIHAPPFLPGPGFVGTKYLRSPILPDGTEAGTVLAGLTTNRGAFPDPNNVNQLYRYISAQPEPGLGRPAVQHGRPGHHAPLLHQQPAVRHPDVPVERPADAACGRPGDDRGGVHLRGAGGDREVPVDPVPGHHDPEPAADRQRHARPTRASDAIDSAMGYRGFLGPDRDARTRCARCRARCWPRRRWRRRSSTASSCCRSRRPRRSSSWSRATTRSPSCGARRRPSSRATRTSPSPTIRTPGSRYDPTYRQFDVEGYRIYRGRTDTPNSWQLVAQFDYAGTPDVRLPRHHQPGRRTCAPELDIVHGLRGPVRPATPPAPPARFTDSVARGPERADHPGRPGGRVALANGTVRVEQRAERGRHPRHRRRHRLPGAGKHRRAVRASRTTAPGCSSAPRNNVRYFYAVTAFDVNSFVSGPSSLESQRTARAVVPVDAGVERHDGGAQLGHVRLGRHGARPGADDALHHRSADRPVQRAAAGHGRCGAGGVFAPLVPSLLPSLDLTATIDSVQSRSTECAAALAQHPAALCAEFFVTFNRGGHQPSSSRRSPHWPIWSVASPRGHQRRPRAARCIPGGARIRRPPRATASRGAASFNAAVGATLTQYIRFSAHGESVGAAASSLQRLAGRFALVRGRQRVGGRSRPTRSGSGTWPGVDTIFAPLSHTDQDPLTPGVQPPASATLYAGAPVRRRAARRQADIELTWGAGGTVRRSRTSPTTSTCRSCRHAAGELWASSPD